MMTTPDALIDAYIDHTIDDEQFESLCDWLREAPANRQTFARKLALHSEIAEWCIERSGESMAGNMDAAENIAELPTIQYTASNTPTKQQYAAALSYVLRHTFTPKRVAVLASAAVLLLGVVLAIVILSGPSEDEPIAELPDVLWPSDEVPVAQRIVATITDEHDAVWDRRPGYDLFAGQRFNLTQGFAEITTNRGAVAILEAPATIEFTDNDNAIELHTGKLVGICETPSSKGFVVRTPHMDVTDLGTRFGVDVKASTSELHVFEGEIEVRHHKSPTTTLPIRLTQAMAVKAASDDDAVIRIDHSDEAFAALQPTTVQLPGTGHGLTAGQTDPNWQIVAVDGQLLDKPQALRVYDISTFTDYAPNDPSSAQWIGMLPVQQPRAGQSITYRFQTRVTLPESMQPQTTQLVLSYGADNQVRAILVNGQRIEVETLIEVENPIQITGWNNSVRFIDEHLVAGDNTIAFEVENIGNPVNYGGDVQLHVRWAFRHPPITSRTTERNDQP